MAGMLRSRPVRCTVLGPITIDGSPLGSPLERRLLAALLVSRGRPVSADRLVDVLWGDEPPTSARNTLQSKVSRLRRLVGTERLRRIGDGYTLDVPDGACDADRFDDLVAAADGLDAAARLAVLDEALALWSGRAYDEYADDDFARPSAAGLEQRRLTVNDQRLDALLELGRHHAVIEATDRLVDEDPFRESFWAARMAALAESGRSVEAVRTYAEVRRRFIDETGLPPSSRLAALEQAIVTADLDDGGDAVGTAAAPGDLDDGAPAPAGDDGGDEPGAATVAGRPPGVGEPAGRDRMAPPRRAGGPGRGDRAAGVAGGVGDRAPVRRFDGPLMTPALVGRTAARAAVDQALAAARTGHPGLVLVTGDVGLGKTRLLEAVGGSARSTGVRVLSGRSVAEVSVPLGPIGQIMSAVGLTRPAVALGSSPAEAIGGPAAGATSIAVLRLLDRIVDQPTVLLLDDLQWADPATASAVELLLAEAEARAAVEPVPLLIVGAHRPLGDDPAHTTLGRLHRHPATRVVELQALDEAAVAEVVRGTTGIRPSGIAATRIHALTDGVPLLVETLLDLWSRRGALEIRAGCLDVSPDAAPAGPADVDTALRRRWDEADPALIDAVTVLALSPLLDLLPLATAAGVVAEVLELDDAEALGALDRAVALGLLDGPPQVRFSSPRVRSFVLDHAGLGARARLLGRLLTVLLDVPMLEGDLPVADRHPSLAVQTLVAARDAGVAVDRADLLWWGLAAGEESLAVGAWPAAVHHLDVAAAAAAPTGQDGPHEQPTLADGTPLDLARGLAAFRAHDEFRAQELLRRAAERAAAQGDGDVEGIALAVVNRIAFAFDGASELPLDPAAASQLLERYIDRRHDDHPRLAAAASALLAEDAAVRDEVEVARAHVERATAIAVAAGLDRLPEVDFAAGLTSLAALELSAAERAFRASSETALAAGDRWVASWGAGRRILTRLYADDLDGAAAAIATALDLQSPIRLWSELALTRALQAAHLAGIGDHDGALSAAELSDLLATRSGYNAGRLIAASVTAHILASRGDGPGARAVLDRLRVDTGRTPWPFLALTELTLGQHDAALRLVEDRLARLPKVPTVNRLPSVVATAAVAATTGSATIVELTEGLVDWMDDHGVRRLPAWPVPIATLVNPGRRPGPIDRGTT